MYCIIKYIVQGKQARVKNADLRHPSCTVVMQKRKSASPVLNVLKDVVDDKNHESHHYTVLSILPQFPQPPPPPNPKYSPQQPANCISISRSHSTLKKQIIFVYKYQFLTTLILI